MLEIIVKTGVEQEPGHAGVNHYAVYSPIVVVF
jgi:hypothetical protein